MIQLPGVPNEWILCENINKVALVLCGYTAVSEWYFGLKFG